MPSRWEISLTGPDDARIPLSAPLAVISKWLDGAVGCTGAETGSRHDDQARKWAFGPLRAMGDRTVLVVRLLDDGLAGRLTAATEPGRPVRLGAQTFQVAEPARLTEQVTWPELLRWSGERAWQVRFVTPACFRRSNRTSPWPAPESVARGLAERWRRLDQPTAPPMPGPGAGPVWVSDIDGRNEVQLISRRSPDVPRRGEEVACGFVGRLRYVCDRGTDAEAAAFHALLRFALFAGVGSHTTYGFGVLMPEPTWQPPTTRKPDTVPPPAKAERGGDPASSVGEWSGGQCAALDRSPVTDAIQDTR